MISRWISTLKEAVAYEVFLPQSGRWESRCCQPVSLYRAFRYIGTDVSDRMFSLFGLDGTGNETCISMLCL